MIFFISLILAVTTSVETLALVFGKYLVSTYSVSETFRISELTHSQFKPSTTGLENIQEMAEYLTRNEFCLISGKIISRNFWKFR